MKQGIILGLLSSVLLFSCSTLNKLLTESGSEETPSQASPNSGPRALRFSEKQNAGVVTDRQYKRMTRTQMEDQSDLQSGAGSLWAGEGQQGYLFTQNKSRKEGDVLNVKLDGSAYRQVETKVGVIQKLLRQLEEDERKQKELQLQKLSQDNAVSAPQVEARGPASTPEGAGASKSTALPNQGKDAEKVDLSEVQVIQTKITERTPEGNYRIRGVQPIMIANREFRVIVSGNVRPEDYNDEGMSSSKILDAQFDVVSLRRKAKE